jgi:hypothetical protein
MSVTSLFVEHAKSPKGLEVVLIDGHKNYKDDLEINIKTTLSLPFTKITLQRESKFQSGPSPSILC